MRSTRFIYLVFALSVIVLAWLGNAYVNENTRSQVKYTEAVEHTYKVIINLRQCEKLLLEAESRQQGFLLTNDIHFKDAAQNPLTGIDSLLSGLSELIKDNPRQRANLFLLSNAIRSRLEWLRNSWTYTNKPKERPAMLLQSKLLMDKVHTYIQAMETEEDALLLSRNTAKNHYQSLNASFLTYAFLFAALICLIAGLMTVRELNQRAQTQKKLERSILDVKRSYEEMEQVTFTASHDLQEPLRKIRTLVSLSRKNSAVSDHEGQQEILSRIERSTEKMHTQLQDLVDFTTLLNATGSLAVVDLNILFANAWKKVFGEENVLLHSATRLPYIRGQEPQLLTLFTELLTNAATYRSKERPLEITVTSKLSVLKRKLRFWQKDLAPRFYEITITDNGIGFDNAFNEKIFVLFQRLNNQEAYMGKGAGLAVVKRIMTNHYGYAEATGEPGKGASFRLYFPVK